MESKTVLGIVGSPNRDGRTYKLVTAALEGAAARGARTELVQMADYTVAACKDCLPWVCQSNLKCTYEDPALEYLTEKVLNCGALVLGSPVYWSDTSGMIRYFILKMFRIFARTAPLKGLPAVGIAIAGGTGNGLVTGLRPLYHFFYTMQMRALEPVPATRFNWDWSLQRSRELGAELAPLVNERKPFERWEERILWYDSLPYVNLNRGEERRLLADVTTEGLADETNADLARGLVRAAALVAAGRHLEAQAEISRVYDAGAKAFNALPVPARVG